VDDKGCDLTIGEAAERTGLSVHALRFYEREGLFIGPVRRSASGHRLYSEADLEWLSTCTRFRASGMPVATIRRFTELVSEGSGNEEERRVLLREHERCLLARISELNDCRDLITAKLGAYDAHLAGGTAGHLWTPSAPVEA
jgi:DNA-binding transcriptional MerR regulator